MQEHWEQACYKPFFAISKKVARTVFIQSWVGVTF